MTWLCNNALLDVSSDGIMQSTRDEENAIRMIITISGVGMLHIGIYIFLIIWYVAIILDIMMAIIHST